MRNQKFARVDAHIKRRSQQACVSCTVGIRVNNVSCSRDLCANCSATYSGVPIGAPRTRIPWLSLGKDEAPFHTTASGFTNLARPGELLNAIRGDSSPVPDLGLALMDINMLMTSLMTASTSATRSGLHTKTTSSRYAKNFALSRNRL